MRDGLERLFRRRQSAGEAQAADQVQSPLSAAEVTPLLEAVRARLLAETTADGVQAAIDPAAVQAVMEAEYNSGFTYLGLTEKQLAALMERIVHQICGLGLLEPLINDPAIKEIMVNGPDQIFIERDGLPEPARDALGAPLRFPSAEELHRVIERIVARVNRKVDESSPIVDARLHTGARVNVVIPPVALGGAAVTIRKFPQQPLRLDTLVQRGSLSAAAHQFLGTLVRARCNVVVSGGTSSGKTTFLNALAAEVPKHERILTIEDSAELQFHGVPNLVRMEARPPNIEGKGAITIRDLVRTSLRMRPDRIIVGECRGAEALDMLQAMNTGHDGSLTTVHANSGRDALNRIETLALMAGLELPPVAIRRQIASAVHFVIHLGRLGDGRRKVMQILEVLESPDGLGWQDLFRLDVEAGELRPTGAKVVRRERFALAAEELPAGI